MADIYNSRAPEIVIRDLDHIFVDERTSNVVTSEVTVGYDGTIILPDIGKIHVAGKSLEEMESLVENLLDKDVQNWSSFQFQLVDFNSQKAIISIENKEGGDASINQIIPITSNPLSLLEALTGIGINIKKNELTKIYFKRDGRITSFLLSDLFQKPKTKSILKMMTLLELSD